MRVGGLRGDGRRLVPEIVDAFRRNGLINFAASISFLIVLSLVPLLLFLLALLGFLQLDEIWRDEVAPQVRGSLSDAAYRLLDDTATRVVTEKQGWWLTGGVAPALLGDSAPPRGAVAPLPP